LENDGVIQRLFKSREGGFSIARLPDAIGEPTEFGTLILPDRMPGSGPIYYCVLDKPA
jgi:hypothetical protein